MILGNMTVGLIAHHSNEQVSDRGRAHIAKGNELLTVGMVE
jgi:hypothetical protein